MTSDCLFSGVLQPCARRFPPRATLDTKVHGCGGVTILTILTRHVAEEAQLRGHEATENNGGSSRHRVHAASIMHRETMTLHAISYGNGWIKRQRKKLRHRQLELLFLITAPSIAHELDYFTTVDRCHDIGILAFFLPKYFLNDGGLSTSNRQNLICFSKRYFLALSDSSKAASSGDV